MMKELTLEFNKIVGEGKTLGRINGKVVFAYGVLPNEIARIKILKEKRNFIEGEVLEILKESPNRVTPKENHFLTCSPWQIMNYDFQVKTKKELIEDLLFQSIKENVKLDNFYKAEKVFNYRTKIEYSFTEENEELFLAFHKRGVYYEKIILNNGCALIDDKTNEIALKILEELNKAKIKKEQLKTLILRRTINTNEVLASLYTKDENINFTCPKINGLTGFILIYSNPISSTSTVDKILKIDGRDFLTEKINNMEFSYPFDSFFQNNIELFEKALKEIDTSLDNENEILDLYSGVGVIGFYLKEKFKKLISVELIKNASNFAKINAEKNKIKNFEIISSPTEKAQNEIFKNKDVILLDPPRAGLHKNVIKNIMENLPKKIVYLSCNPLTQGRDAVFFLEKYKIIKAIGFDFYPNTPHMENLLVFEKKN